MIKLKINITLKHKLLKKNIILQEDSTRRHPC